MDSSNNKKSLMYFLGNMLLYIGHIPNNVQHKAPTDVFSICLDDEFQVSTNNGKTWKTCNSVYWPANTPHRCRFENKLIASLFIEPDEKDKIGLKHEMTQDDGNYAYAIKNRDEIIQKMLFIYNLKLGFNETQAIINGIVKTKKAQSNNNLDPRILKAMSYIKQTIDKDCHLHELAKHVNLSKSRLLHLFKDETRITILKYKNWLKIKKVVKKMGEGKRLTEAAIEVGFVDAAHFNKTFKKYFGLPPTSFLLSKQKTQAIIKPGLSEP